MVEFLWEEVTKLPSDATFLTNNDKNLFDLLNTVVLATYCFDTYKSEKKQKDQSIIVEKKDRKYIEDNCSLKQQLESFDKLICAN